MRNNVLTGIVNVGDMDHNVVVSSLSYPYIKLNMPLIVIHCISIMS